MRYGAYIFDMDDLLVASAHIWRAAEESLLRAIGHAWTADLANEYKGMNALDVAATIHRITRPALPVAACQAIMRDALLDGFNGDIQMMPGAVDLVRRLKGRLPMAVASGSPLAAIRRALTAGGIIDCFDQLITSESVPRGKPFPDVFLDAANALRIRPENCLVFEDSQIGVRAARAAGMQVFCVPSGEPQLVRQLATGVYPTLAEISEQDLVGA